jgi:hypothetical protein
VIGTLNILTHPGKILFDMGATSSFISRKFIDAHRISICVLEHPMLILSTGGTIVMNHAKMDQVIMIYRHAITFSDTHEGDCSYLGNGLVVRKWNRDSLQREKVSLKSTDGGRIVYQGDKNTRIKVEL